MILLNIQDRFYDLLENHFGATFTMCVLVGVAIVSGIIWLSIWLYRAISKNKEIERRVDSLPCTEHSAKLDRIIATETKVDALPCTHHSERMEKHDEQIAETRTLARRIEAQLDLLVKTLVPSENRKQIISLSDDYSRKHSPRQLNENGMSLLMECGGDKFINQHADFFISKIEALAPKTALDVEELSAAVLFASTSEDMFIPLKNWVYNAPSRELKNDDDTTKKVDVSINDIIFVMSLPLRDKYLKLHPEILS